MAAGTSSVWPSSAAPEPLELAELAELVEILVELAGAAAASDEPAETVDEALSARAIATTVSSISDKAAVDKAAGQARREDHREVC